MSASHKGWVDGVDTLMNKKVISSDLKELGKIVSVDKDSLTILRGDNHYIIPKVRVWAMVGNSDAMVDFRLPLMITFLILFRGS